MKSIFLGDLLAGRWKLIVNFLLMRLSALKRVP